MKHMTQLDFEKAVALIRNSPAGFYGWRSEMINEGIDSLGGGAGLRNFQLLVDSGRAMGVSSQANLDFVLQLLSDHLSSLSNSLQCWANVLSEAGYAHDDALLNDGTPTDIDGQKLAIEALADEVLRLRCCLDTIA
ncbi:MAG: hypothetical protein CVU31_00175 [Betaproteobacteria bacterium HGW-Betaproteobacteria-4]|jgi:hypothetical protein|nr:MAG: hypothetical protein CVU31_00175 [Betaproteobacteria bacterium HGW-Betaproteobacteria-4]